MQIGQGRGGFYSYEWLENLIGCDIHNADRILPEFQDLKIGDGIRLHPQMPPMPVEVLEPGRAFVLHGDTRQGGPSPTMPKGYSNLSWLFFVEEVSAGYELYFAPLLKDWGFPVTPESEAITGVYPPADIPW